MKALFFFVGTMAGVIGSVVGAQVWLHLVERSAYTGRGVNR